MHEGSENTQEKRNRLHEGRVLRPALVELSDDGEILTLHTALPEGAKMIRKKISKEAFERWTLRAKEKWNNK